MADMAFCWVERAPVDVSVIAAGPSALLVGGNGVVEVTVRNRGYATADPISLRIRASEHVGVTDCSGPLGCALTLGPGEETVISIAVTGRSAGLAEIVADAVVPAEPPALGDDNTAVVEFVVDAVAADVPGSSPPDEVVVSPVVIAAEELPETGPVDALWLLLAGTALIAVGSRLVRFGTAR
jgi:LPXTG-motif cell wall-anchored protein